MDAFVSGAWRTPTRAEAYINGDWRKITRGEMYRNGTWVKILNFVQPLTLDYKPNVSGIRTGTTGATVTTGPAYATPVGGVGPYSYLWTVDNGSIGIGSPTSSTTQFTAYVPLNSTITATATVTCTDANGSTASADVGITLSNQARGV